MSIQAASCDSETKRVDASCLGMSCGFPATEGRSGVLKGRVLRDGKGKHDVCEERDRALGGMEEEEEEEEEDVVPCGCFPERGAKEGWIQKKRQRLFLSFFYI